MGEDGGARRVWIRVRVRRPSRRVRGKGRGWIGLCWEMLNGFSLFSLRYHKRGSSTLAAAFAQHFFSRLLYILYISKDEAILQQELINNRIVELKFLKKKKKLMFDKLYENSAIQNTIKKLTLPLEAFHVWSLFCL